MKTFRNSAQRQKPDYITSFIIKEFILCALLLAVCFLLLKLLPDTFAGIREKYQSLTESGFTLPEIGTILTKAAKQVMDYLGVAPQGGV